MLKILRNKKTAKKIWLGLALIIVPAFIFWGSGSMIRSQERGNLPGRIFGRAVSQQEYQEALLAVKNQAMMQFGDNLGEIQKYVDFNALAWQRLVLLAEARKKRINASDAEVIGQIESLPLFKNAHGQFDNRLYNQILQYVLRTQPRTFEEQVRQNIIMRKLYEKVTSDIKIDDRLLKEEYKKTNQEVSVSYIAAIPSDFISDLNITEQQEKEYFLKNEFEFKMPISYNLEYVTLSSEGKSEEELKDTIQKLSISLHKKNNLKGAAGELGLQVKETGLFTEDAPIPGIGWSQEVSRLLSKWKAGKAPITIASGKEIYVLVLKEKKAPYVPDFETVKDRAREKLLKDTAKQIARQKIEECLARLKSLPRAEIDEEDFKKAASTSGLKFESTGPFKYGTYMAGIGSSDDFWNAAVGMKEEQYSGVIAMDSGFYIIRLKNISAFDEKRFLEEKEGFSQKLLERKKEERFTKFLEDLLRLAAPGGK